MSVSQHEVITERYALYNGDCADLLAQMPDGFIDYSIFSPPFASLYVYSDSPNDMGNSRTYQEFFEQFAFFAEQMYRVMSPGRNMSFHCANIPMMKERDGVIGLRDFRGDLIRAFQREGFIYHAETLIWKDPVTEMQRTKALGLLHKQIKKDSCMSRMGIPDYLVTMRKPGVNPKRVTHTDETFPVSQWQRWASPVWMDVDQSNTLNFVKAREMNDERHICPLQLDVIERGVTLWSNPGDTVLSPFMGIGSEGYTAVKMDRRFVGIELKRSYFDCAVRNLADAERLAESVTLFDLQ